MPTEKMPERDTLVHDLRVIQISVARGCVPTWGFETLLQIFAYNKNHPDNQITREEASRSIFASALEK